VSEKPHDAIAKFDIIEMYSGIARSSLR